MIRIQLNSEDFNFIHDAWIHMDYTRARRSEEEFNVAHLNYQQLLVEIKESYGIKPEIQIQHIDFGTGLIFLLEIPTI